MKMIHHICIQTNNYQKSLDFYTNILGFKKVKETKDFHDREYNTWLENYGIMIELQTGKNHEILIKPTNNNEGLVHFGFTCDDIENEYNRIASLGYNNFILKNDEVIYQVYNSKLFKLIAPEGTIIEMRNTSVI